jgi:hypothetical protein
MRQPPTVSSEVGTLAGIPAELHDIARKVRRIGRGHRHNPEAMFKEGLAERIIDIAMRLEAAPRSAPASTETNR